MQRTQLLDTPEGRAKAQKNLEHIVAIATQYEKDYNSFRHRLTHRHYEEATALFTLATDTLKLLEELSKDNEEKKGKGHLLENIYTKLLKIQNITDEQLGRKGSLYTALTQGNGPLVREVKQEKSPRISAPYFIIEQILRELKTRFSFSPKVEGVKPSIRKYALPEKVEKKPVSLGEHRQKIKEPKKEAKEEVKEEVGRKTEPLEDIDMVIEQARQLANTVAIIAWYYPRHKEFNHHHLKTANTLDKLAQSLLSEMDKAEDKQDSQKIIRKFADLMNFVTRITEKGGQLDQRGDLYNALANAKGPFADKENKVSPTQSIRTLTNYMKTLSSDSWSALKQIMEQPDAQKLTCELATQLIELAQLLYPKPTIGFFKTKLTDDEIASLTELKKAAQSLLESPQNADKAAVLLTTLKEVNDKLDRNKLLYEALNKSNIPQARSPIQYIPLVRSTVNARLAQKPKDKKAKTLLEAVNPSQSESKHKPKERKHST